MKIQVLTPNRVAIAWLCLLVHAQMTTAEDDPKEIDPRLEDRMVEVQLLEQDKLEAQYALEIAKAEKELAETLADEEEPEEEKELPDTEEKGLEGTATFNEGAGAVAVVASYKALEKAGAKIATKLKDDLGIGTTKGLALFNEFNVTSAFVALRMFDTRMKLINDELSQLEARLSGARSNQIEEFKRVLSEEQLKYQPFTGKVVYDGGDLISGFIAENIKSFEDLTKPQERISHSVAEGDVVDLNDIDHGYIVNFAPGLIEATAYLGVLKEISGFFKTEVSYTGVTVATEDKALWTSFLSSVSDEVAKKFLILGMHYVPAIEDADSVGGAIQQIFNTFDSVTSVKEKLNEVTAKLEAPQKASKSIRDKMDEGLGALAALKKKIDEFEKDKTSLPDGFEDIKKRNGELTKQIKSLKAAISDEEKKTVDGVTSEGELLDSISKALQAYVKTLLQAGEGGAEPGMVEVLKAEALGAEAITHYLFLKIISQRGEIVNTKRNFLSAKVDFYGTVAVSYLLTGKDGKVVASGTVQGAVSISHNRRSSTPLYSEVIEIKDKGLVAGEERRRRNSGGGGNQGNRSAHRQ